MSLDKSLPTGLTATLAGTDTAVVICNGPSLASVPNSWLLKFPTFGANRIWLKYHPNVLLTLDFKMVHNEILQQEMARGFRFSDEVFISPVVAKYMKDQDLLQNVHTLKAWNNIVDDLGNLKPVFSSDPLNMLVSGGSVTYGLLQMAYWKGFKRILLVGLNHTWRDPRGDHFDNRYNTEVQIPYEKENVDPSEYKSAPGSWFWSEEGFVEKTNMFFDVARQIFEREGGEVINCTPDTKCPVFRVDDWRNY